MIDVRFMPTILRSYILTFPLGFHFACSVSDPVGLAAVPITYVCSVMCSTRGSVIAIPLTRLLIRHGVFEASLPESENHFLDVRRGRRPVQSRHGRQGTDTM